MADRRFDLTWLRFFLPRRLAGVVLLAIALMSVAMSAYGLEAGRGGLLLPPGPLSTRGSQIVDSKGVPVRIAGIGWQGSDGGPGSGLEGLGVVSYQSIILGAKDAGFNCLRIPWTDVNLDTPPARAPGWATSPDLTDLGNFAIFEKIVAYCSTIGMKVIFDHHDDDGCGGQQGNGLWFDNGPGTDGTDGSGHTGTITYARFKSDWVRFARQYRGNHTVIGFDLDNEPHCTSWTGPASGVNWGGGGPDDIWAMYTDVGNTIQLIDSDALIICEGPMDVTDKTSLIWWDMDLTHVATKPVVLKMANKVLYSVHEYPTEVSAAPNDSGPVYVKKMNEDWGYLVRQNIAPVWIGEMGASMITPGERAWAKTLLAYMNGELGAQGGPTFRGDRQGVSGSWWVLGANPGWDPDGNQTKPGPGNYRPEQLAVTDLMLMRHYGRAGS